MRMRLERTYHTLTSPTRTPTFDPPVFSGASELVQVEWEEQVAVVTWLVTHR